MNEQYKLPWHEAPDWARYAAMDMSGDWYWYAYDPPLHHKGIGWSTGPHKFRYFVGPQHEDWKIQNKRDHERTRKERT